MFIDARAIPKNTAVETDVCIVGAGAAGITLTRELTGHSLSVCLLESGGLEYETETQSLAGGRSVGLSYPALHTTRLRFFGGTTNHWNGTCRPLDDIDFQKRDWIPHSGWPFDRSELLPYYKRAQPIVQLGPFVYSDYDWHDVEKRQSIFDGSALTSAIFQQSPPTRFGKTYQDEIERAPNVTTYLHANVLELETNASGRTITRARVTSLERNDFYVSARIFILATGGIENARLLLLSNAKNRQGLGNDHGLVGRFFMDHPIVGDGNAGLIALIAPTDFSRLLATRKEFDNFQPVGKADKPPRFWHCITPSAQEMRRAKLLNFGIGIELFDGPDVPGYASARKLKRLLTKGEYLGDLWEIIQDVISNIDDIVLTDKPDPLRVPLQVSYWAEPMPNPDSRVYLSNERDIFGQPRIELDWRLTDLDKENFGHALMLLGTELGRTGLGRLGANPEVWDEDWVKLVALSWHHMGTTRMHANPKSGVVDANCRVHGVSNLYVAGSSIFPTAGHATPTFTIVALALRLADHIKAKMG